jgi:hypothetical protein
MRRLRKETAEYAQSITPGISFDSFSIPTEADGRAVIS